MSKIFIAFTVLSAFAFTGTIQADDLAAQQPTQDPITGTITEMAQNVVTVQTDDQRVMTVRVDRQTRILNEEGQRMELREGNLLGDLSTGDRVVLHYRVGEGDEHIAVSIAEWTEDWQQEREAVATQDQQRQEQRQEAGQVQDSITGTITAMNDNEMTLRTDRQESMTVRVDQQTRVLDDRRQQIQARAGNLLGNLSTGDQVVVHYRAGDDAADRTAMSIQRRASTAQAQDQPRQQDVIRQQDELPRTSSTLPLIAALGLIGIAGAGALTVAARREH